jgi:uncharacterized beta-barrel protein YwiB (DUF1934 family)
MFLGDTLFR